MNDSIAAPARDSLTTRRRSWLLPSLFFVTAAAIVALVAFSLRRGDDLRHFTAAVEQGDIRDTVESTGTVNAVINVLVGSQVSGTIARLNADFNSHVHKGDIIATIDSRLFLGTLKQAEADLESAKANVLASEANLQRSKATQSQMKAELARSLGLAGKGFLSQAELDLARANFETADAAVAAAQAMVKQAKGQVSQKAAAVAVARTNLEYTVIRSPIDGVVVARNVDVGQTVAASLQAPTIFTIAQDLTKMLLYAKVDESDVGRIRAGQHVTFKVDAFPQEQFQGSVREIRMNPTTIQNVVTYDTVIEFDNPDLKLFPGMTAYVTIPVATVENVLKVPNAALRYKPPMSPERVRALYSKYGIDATEPSSTLRDGFRPSATGGSQENAPLGAPAVVWKLSAAGTLVPVKIIVGITDHTFTEVRSVVTGSLKPGDQVVTSSVESKSLPPGVQGIPR
jgi:HlyD family secretion protein